MHRLEWWRLVFLKCTPWFSSGLSVFRNNFHPIYLFYPLSTHQTIDLPVLRWVQSTRNAQPPPQTKKTDHWMVEIWVHTSCSYNFNWIVHVFSMVFPWFSMGFPWFFHRFSTTPRFNATTTVPLRPPMVNGLPAKVSWTHPADWGCPQKPMEKCGFWPLKNKGYLA